MRMNWFRLGRGYLEEDVQVSAADLIENVLERDSMTRLFKIWKFTTETHYFILLSGVVYERRWYR